MTDQPTEHRPYRHVLFCTDFSQTADKAFDYAIDAARCRADCTVTLLHVIPEPDAQFWKTYIYEVEAIDEKARHDVDEKIETTYRPRVPEGVPFQAEVRIGNVTSEILTFAEQHDVDLVVLGRRGHSSLGDILFGAVTDKIARKAPCPVLIIPQD